jgi:hypothetical protein
VHALYFLEYAMIYAEFTKEEKTKEDVVSTCRSVLVLQSSLRFGEVYKRLKEHAKAKGATHYALYQRIKDAPPVQISKHQTFNT